MDPSADDKQQFEEFVRLHHIRLRAFIRSLGIRADSVDDLAQEALLTAFRQWQAFDQERDLGKWVRGIAANLVRNEIRKEARRWRILQDDVTVLLLRRHSDQPRRSELVSDESIRECIDELDERSKAIIQGRYRDQETSSETAERMELAAANVRQILLRARRQIKTCIESRVLRRSENE